MRDKSQENTVKIANFSKDNPIIEISSKQSQTNAKNITPPVKPKETKKE